MSKKNEKSETNIMDDYIELTNQNKEKYGEKTVVLLQVGAFFEVYGLKNLETSEVTGSNIEEFSQICQLNVSEKKITYKGKQVVMAGFRDYTLEKYLQKLTDNGYNAAVYVQEKDGKNIKRVFYGAYSAGTYISYETESSPQITNNIMCVWMDTYKPFEKGGGAGGSKMKNHIIYGVATVNIFTGKSSIFEHQSPFLMNPTTFDELERYVSVFSPSEVVFISSFDDKTVNSIIQFSGVKTNSIHRLNLNEHKEVINCTKQSYIKHILSKFFGEEMYNVCKEFENHVIATQAFCYLLHFIQQHNSNLTRNFSIPTFNNSADRMILANHTLKQLNVIDDQSNDGKRNGNLSCVLSLLNKCNTAMGRRRFQYQLLNPTTNREWLNKEYEMIEKVLAQENGDIIDAFRKKLTQARDVEKLCRQLIVKRIYPSSVFHLYNTVDIVEQLNTCVYENDDLCSYLCDEFKMNGENPFDFINNLSCRFIDFINEKLHIDKCKNANSINSFDDNIIKTGVSPTLDQAVSDYNNNIFIFNETKSALNDLAKRNTTNDTEHVKVHETEKSGLSLQITKTRGNAMKKIIKEILESNNDTQKSIKIGITGFEIALKDIKFVTASGSNDDIEIPALNKIIKEIFFGKEKMNKLITETYFALLETIEKDWFSALEIFAEYISKLDVLLCKAHVSKIYKYCKPIIVEGDGDKSMVDAHELRHCLIEHLQQNEVYVTNDIEIGDQTNGILLYGTNAVGKTSFIRALGIAIIMAQSGMFVPCSSFSYVPYNSIYSRILGNDNIFKGLSTFAVEMSELRIILKMADQNSLILGDELCSGTETESALSIFVAGLMELHEKNSTFIFATHFHEIINYDEVKEMDRLSLMHMSVIYDREKDCLIYDRKLKEGPGTRTYGLEVCKSLYLSEDFLERAYSIRNKYHPHTNGELSQIQSRYNSGKIRGVCEMCNKNMGEEIHHLEHQKDADINGFIGSLHKNHPANLLSVCEKCHNKFHDKTDVQSKAPIQKKKTTKGYKLI
jgi:DNA mismatch repair protein MutS